MNLPFFIARRYLRSRKSHSVINLITWVAGLAIAIPSAALIIILSVHNGLSEWTHQLYSMFEPQLMVTSLDSKFFDPSAVDLEGIDGIEQKSLTIQDNILVKNDSREYLGTIKGVDANYHKVIPFTNLVAYGQYRLYAGSTPQAIIGDDMAYNMGLNPPLMRPMGIYAILPERGNSIVPTPVYRAETIMPSGIFVISDPKYSRYMIVPLDYAQMITGFRGKISAVEIRLADNADQFAVKQAIEHRLGTTFKVATLEQQQASLYKSINQEKWIIYLILIMVLSIAAMSLAGTLLVLIANKRTQISTLRSMGADTGLVRAIFRNQGLLIVFIGSTVGIVLGVAFSLLQQHYGLVGMDKATAVDNFPAKVQALDVVVAMVGVWLVGWILSAITTTAAIKHK